MSISLMASVLLTLAYTDQFFYPLSAQEIKQRLVLNKISDVQLEKILVDLQQRGLLTQRKKSWQLVGGLADEKLRASRRELAKAKWVEVEELKKIIGWIPWVKGLAVTGSLSMNNLRQGADIDFMVVTQARRLWLTRLLVTLLAWVAGKRRTWRGAKIDGWCFNLWLDASALGMRVDKRNVYTAYEVCQAKWVIDRGGVQREFYLQNNWVERWLPSFYPAGLENTVKLKKISGSKFIDLLNILAFKLQYLYMYSHMTRERVRLQQAFFHPRQTWKIIYRRWLDSLSRTGKKVVLATGVFDLLHQEHINFLNKARQVGDILLVGVESDVRVRELKGSGRPINHQHERQRQLQALPEVDLAFVLPEKFSDEQDHLALLKKIRPAVLAVSSHTAHLEQKRRVMKQIGGEVRVVCEYNPEVSTTKMVDDDKLYGAIY